VSINEETTPPTPPRRRRRWPWVVGTIVVLLLAISAAGAGMSGTNDNPAVRDRAVDTTEEAAVPAGTDEVTTTTAEDDLELVPSMFTPSLTVKSKQCFGSAGCNVTFQVDLTYFGNTDDLEGRTFDVTYQVDGGDSGPIVGTVSATGASYDVQENFASTHSSEAPLTVKVTAVEEYEF
jgi:hypothetical protein